MINKSIIKIEMKYNGEEQLLNSIAKLREVATIKKISKPKHNNVWDKVFIDLVFNL